MLFFGICNNGHPKKKNEAMEENMLILTYSLLSSCFIPFVCTYLYIIMTTLASCSVVQRVVIPRLVVPL
jgi:hypothetical protein